MSVITVSDNIELLSAINKLEAEGGGTILLENNGGTYNLTKNNLGTAEGTITFTSADSDDPAVMDGVRTIGSQNLSFENLIFDSAGISRDSWIKDLMIEQSTNISVSDSTFTSRADGTYQERGGDVSRGEDAGLIRDTQGFTFTNNTVANYFHGLAIIDTNDIHVAGNEFSGIQGDGIRGGGMQDAVFEDNWFHDWYGSAKDINHDDMFQIWGTGMDQLSKNIVIRDNFFDAGEGVATQTILIQNERWNDESDNYSNITVTNNVIYNADSHGITIADTDGVVITDNTLLHNTQAKNPTGGGSNAPRIRADNGENVVISGNISSGAFIDNKEFSGDNVTLDYKSPSDPDYFQNHFVNLAFGGKVDLRDLELLPDSSWYQKYGAEATQGGDAGSGVNAVMVRSDVPGEYGTFMFDASLSNTSEGYLDPDTTTYEWHFADGSVVNGSSVIVSFKNTGLNAVELTVTSDDGETDTIMRTVNLNDPLVRSTDFNDGADTANLTFADVSEENFVEGLTGRGFLLDGDSEAAFNKKTSGFHNMDEFTIDLAFRKLEAADTGRMMDFHKTMSMGISENGKLSFGMKTTDGSFSVNSGDVTVSDTDWHKISVTYNSVKEELTLWMDGNKLGQTEATGDTPEYQTFGPQLGNMDWKSPGLVAVVDDFAIYGATRPDADIQQDHMHALSLSESELDEIYAPADNNSGGTENVPQEEPAQKEEPVVEEKPEPQEEPAQKEDPVAEEKPEPQEEPAQKEDPVAEEKPEPQEEPAQKEDPVAEEKPEPQEEPAQKEDPVAEEEEEPVVSQGKAKGKDEEDESTLAKLFNIIFGIFGGGDDDDDENADMAVLPKGQAKKLAAQEAKHVINIDDIPTVPMPEEAHNDDTDDNLNDLLEAI